MQEQLGIANNLWVFREGKTTVDASELRQNLDVACASLLNGSVSFETVIDALLRAGEFESALGDAAPSHSAPAESLTNVLARALWEEDRNILKSLPTLLGELRLLSLPEQVSISPPEGFAYYALHPLDFAALASNVAESCESAAIIGIRSIGTTLSAIVLGAMRHRGRPSDRITVRPTGHPYDRVTRLTREQSHWIDERYQKGYTFLIVDEGPGRSGSSFLSVAEALQQAGVPEDRITLLGSRPINPDELCAKNAATRWRRFHFLWAQPARYGRFNDDIYIGGGHWREALLGSSVGEWPSCWPQMERFKFLSRDRKWIYKFEGFGRFGKCVLDRAQLIADAGFGPSAESAGDGMIRTPLIAGEVLTPASASRDVLVRVAEYCAFRAREFSIGANRGPSQLPEMVRFNVQQVFGIDLDLDLSPLSVTEVLADGRMQSHEWAIGPDHKLLKFDSCTHGDDHFFPGPTDIAWDLAGATIEWNLKQEDTDFLLSKYYHFTRDNATHRLRLFLLAYSIFRMSYCNMALSSVTGTPDFSRLRCAAEQYRLTAEHQLRRLKQLPDSESHRLQTKSVSLPYLSPEAGSAA